MASKRKKPVTVLAAAESDDRLKTLFAMRDKLAKAIDECDSMRDLSSLNKQLLDTLKEIAALTPDAKVVDLVDSINQDRNARTA